MNINAGHQIDPRSLKEVLLAVSNWDVSAREWSQCRWWGGRQYFSQGGFPNKFSQGCFQKNIAEGGFPQNKSHKKISKNISHKYVFKKHFS